MKTTIKLMLATFILSIIISSCNSKESKILEGDLYFKSIKFKSAYGASDEEYKLLLRNIDSILNTDDDSNMYKLHEHFNRLKEYDLLRNPYIYLRIEEDSLRSLYLSESQYEKVKDFNGVDLHSEDKKVRLKLLVRKYDKDIFYSDSILEVKKVNDNKK